MTNWPNIQEYRNFEAKFIDDPKRNVLTDSAADSYLETVVKNDFKAKDNANDFINNGKLENNESKIIRCVIKKDFEETFKKVDRQEGVSLNQECVRPKPEERVVDKIRLQNHLKWMKQKEEEYLQKKEAEKIAQQKKREEELRLEKEKEQREKKRQEKIKEWKEQKAREKEEKKKEKMVIKMLEDGMKVTPSVDKEKLIEEWVKLKDKQRQIEAEKKAELLKKEEENRALRQTLAELSYRQWKERIKGRMMALPKNGYQIFGPKPTPVVKEDWNHDFTIPSPRSGSYTLRSAKSKTTTFTFCPAVKELENLSKDIYYLGDIKSRSPSFYHLKTVRSGMKMLEAPHENQKVPNKMPLKELQPGTVDLKTRGRKPLKGVREKRSDSVPCEVYNKSEMKFSGRHSARVKHPENNPVDLLCLPEIKGDHNRCTVSSLNKKASELWNVIPNIPVLPNKKKLDLYINTSPENDAENSQVKLQKKQIVKNNDPKTHKEIKKEVAVEKKPCNQTQKNNVKEKNTAKPRLRSLSLQKFAEKSHSTAEGSSKVPLRKRIEPENIKVKICKKSQSREKSVKKMSKTEQRLKVCPSPKSTVKGLQSLQNLRIAKSKTCCNQKRIRKLETSQVTKSKSEKKLSETDHKTKKKLKRKNSLPKSFSFIDSPYCAKNSLRTFNRVKASRRKNPKFVDTKSDEGGQCRKSPTGNG